MYRTAGMLVVALACAAGALAGEVDKADKAAGTAAFTLGRVQKQLYPGLSQADVVERLGRPEHPDARRAGAGGLGVRPGRDDSETSSSKLGIAGAGSGAGSIVAGIIGVSAGKHSEKTRSSQRTLTVVVRFSTAGAVESFSWHDSRI